jgi:3-deoxy-7-phosphoheptulonate synthase
MLVVMRSGATDEEIRRVIDTIRAQGLEAHPLPGATRTAIGMTGNTGAVNKGLFEVLPGVEEAIRVTKPFKLASREMKKDDTVITTTRGDIGPKTLTLIAGPCSVEQNDVVLRTAEHLMSRGIRWLRAGAFKPRTSPYSFQGMGIEGLKMLAQAREKTGIGIVTELMDVENAEAVEEATDIIQIGARNMQNFSLLKRVGKCRKPVLLKRGLSATLEEWLMSAEYILAGGNYDVILCERGVRTFSDHSRNTLDLSVIPPAKALSHLPIFVDPSHGTGKRKFVPAMALAGVAAGADGLLIEAHPDPDHAFSDAAQTISLETLNQIQDQVRALGQMLGRTMPTS